MGKTKQQLIVDNNTSFPNNNANYITPALLRDFNRDMIDNTVNQDVYTADSYSFDNRIDNLETASSSFVTSAITASSLVTASFAAGTITFTKGNGSTFGIVIPDITGSTIPDGTISSSAQITDLGFINSTVTASMDVSSSEYAATASLARNVIISARNANQSTLPIGTVVRISGANGDNPNFNTASYESEINSSNTLGILANTAVSGDYADITVIGRVVGVNTAGMAAGDLLYLSSSGQFTNVAPQAPLNIVTLGEVLRVQQNNGSIFVNVSNGWELNELHNVRIVSAAQGDVLVYEASSSLWKNQPSSSFANASTFNAFTQSIQAEVDDIQAKTGSFATTGSNAFIGVESISGNSGSAQGETYLLGYSGSLIIGNFTNTPTYAALGHITSSQINTNTNLIFKNSTTTQETIVSGSANIFPNPTAATAGFKRYVGTSNIFTHGNSVPQITGSITSNPITMNGNIFSHTATNAFTYRGPVSSSASIINHNILVGAQLNFGQSTASSFDKGVAGTNAIGNALFNGFIGVVAKDAFLSSSVNVNGNLLFGAGVTLNCNSSSISYESNVQNGGITVHNNFVPIASTTANATRLISSVNTIYGIGHALFVTGSNTATTQGKKFYANIIAGTFLTSSISQIGDNCNILATGMIGNSLIISGSTTTSTFAGAESPNSSQGSLFAGRFNSVDGRREKTGETVFAIGTGTSNTNRKTGFLIDSGSNTFVEGTLNVSGSTSFTGSVNVSTTLTLGQSNPLPAGTTGMLAVSASLLWFYDATQWRQVSLV